MANIALRMLDLALANAGAKNYSLEYVTVSEAGTTKLMPNEIAVSLIMNVSVEDTDFAVSVTSDTEGIEYSFSNCSYGGRTNSGIDIYRSPAVQIHKGFITIEITGTPDPIFFFSYLKATILE